MKQYTIYTSQFMGHFSYSITTTMCLQCHNIKIRLFFYNHHPIFRVRVDTCTPIIINTFVVSDHFFSLYITHNSNLKHVFTKFELWSKNSKGKDRNLFFPKICIYKFMCWLSNNFLLVFGKCTTVLLVNSKTWR